MTQKTQSLGICVASKAQLAHVLGLARAARAAGKEVQVFFTGEGVQLTQDPSFGELLEVTRLGSSRTHGHVGVCEVSYMANGLHGKKVAGLVDKDFVTQGRNAEMVEECDRYVVL